MPRPFRAGVSDANVGTGFAAGANDMVSNFLGVMNLGNQAKYADIYQQRQDLDKRRQDNEEAFVMGQHGAQENPMGGVRGTSAPVGAEALGSEFPDPTGGMGADGQGQPPQPQTPATAKPLGTAKPGMAKAFKMGGGPLQQAEEYRGGSDAAVQAYKRAGEASIERDRFQHQLKGELSQYKQIESGLAKTMFETQNLRQAHREAQAVYGPGSPEVLKVEADLAKLQANQTYYKKQLGDFRNTVLGLASSVDPETGETIVEDQGLYDALSMWLDKGTTVGQREGIEFGLSAKPRMGGMKSRGGGMRMPTPGRGAAALGRR